jgi:hypothetical protein
MANIKLGIHTAISAGKPTFHAATAITFIAKMYINTNSNPMAILIPIPPRFFLEATETPMMVRI